MKFASFQLVLAILCSVQWNLKQPHAAHAFLVTPGGGVNRHPVTGFATIRPPQPPYHRYASASVVQQHMSSSSNTDDDDDDEEKPTTSAALEWDKQQKKELQEDTELEAKEEEDDDVSTTTTTTTTTTTDATDTTTTTTSANKNKKKFVIVGGGWGGWGAAKALCQSTSSDDDMEVILVDALPDPTGQTPYLSSTGKPVEAGTRGFWKDYPNINALVEELNLNEDDIFTPFTNSSFYSPDGLEATAPVFSEATLPSLLPKELQDNIPSFLQDFVGQQAEEAFPQLPSPFGQVLATFPLFERIPLADRASMVGLLLATIDCLGSDEDVQEQYDRMTAHDLFIKFKLSKRLVDDFIRPTLLVGLFKPPEELSALVVMELLYYYALAHQDSFDVRWIKKGTVSDSLIAPLAEKLQDEYPLQVLGGCRVGEISLTKKKNKNDDDSSTHLLAVDTISYSTMDGSTHTITDIDGVVLALGCKGMENVIRSSPELAKLEVFSKAASLKGIDVISSRIWFDRKVETRTPANVFSKFEALRGSGGTFFMLDQLQEDDPSLWGDDTEEEGTTTNEHDEPRGSVVACDFYNAGALLSLSDEDIIQTLTEELLPSAVPKFADAKVVDSWVGKYPGVVSWFSPGSYDKRPPLEGAGSQILPGLKCAGDWVRMGEREHGAKGLCQERAFVSGLEAANALLRDVDMDSSMTTTPAEVLPVRDDEPQFKAGVALNREVMKYVPRFWVR